MGMVPTTEPLCCDPCDAEQVSGAINEQIGVAYDTVKTVADNIQNIQEIADEIRADEANDLLRPRTLSFGVRYREHTYRRAMMMVDANQDPLAVNRPELIYQQMIGFAQNATGGLGKAVYIVDNESLDPGRKGSWPWAYLMLQANGGGNVVFIAKGDMRIPVDTIQRINMNDVTLIAPGGNVTFYCDTGSGGFIYTGKNIITAFIKFATMPGILAGINPETGAKIERKMISVDPISIADDIVFINCDTRHSSDGSIDIYSSALSILHTETKVSIINHAFWDSDQPVLIGGAGQGSFADPILVKVSLINPVFLYCGQRQPRVKRFAFVDYIDGYAHTLPFQRDQLDDSVAEFSDCSGISSTNGGRFLARGSLWSCALGGSTEFAAAYTYVELSDGAGQVIDCAAENAMSMAVTNSDQIPALPYVIEHTPVPAPGPAREAWIAQRLLKAGAGIQLAPEGEFTWSTDTRFYPNGTTVLTDRKMGLDAGRWVRTDLPSHILSNRSREVAPSKTRGANSTFDPATGTLTIPDHTGYSVISLPDGVTAANITQINGSSAGREVTLRVGNSAHSITFAGGGNIASSTWMTVTGLRLITLIMEGTLWYLKSTNAITPVTQAALDQKAAANHSHNDLYYTKAEVDAMVGTGSGGVAGVSSVNGRSGAVTLTKSDVGLANVDNTSDANKPISTAVQTALNGKAATAHSHVIADVTGLQTALDGKQAAGNYAAAAHTHAIGDITNLQTSLDGKQASHSNLTGLAGLVVSVGNAGKSVRVNAAGTGFELTTPATAAWGSITGNLANQTDLSNALAAKFDKAGGTITGATTLGSPASPVLLTINGGGSAAANLYSTSGAVLRLRTANAVASGLYVEFFRDGANITTRSAFLGYGGGSNQEFTLQNSLGSFDFVTLNGANITVNGVAVSLAGHTHDYASTTHNHDGIYAAAGHNHNGTYQPAHANLTSLAGLTLAADKMVKVNPTGTGFALGDSLPALASGEFTPALTGVTNTTSLTLGKAFYSRVGRVVQVSMEITHQATAAGDCTLQFDLPIPMDITATGEVAGVGAVNTSSSTKPVGPVYGAIGGDKANYRFYANTTTAVTHSITYSYLLPA